jgi:hypothetical protein
VAPTLSGMNFFRNTGFTAYVFPPLSPIFLPCPSLQPLFRVFEFVENHELSRQARAVSLSLAPPVVTFASYFIIHSLGFRPRS